MSKNTSLACVRFSKTRIPNKNWQVGEIYWRIANVDMILRAALENIKRGTAVTIPRLPTNR
jgi:hypothetical protein